MTSGKRIADDQKHFEIHTLSVKLEFGSPLSDA